MSEDMEFLSDNSAEGAEATTEPSNGDDNSDVQSQTTSQEPAQEEKICGSKFATLEEAQKGYSELEKKLGQQSGELGELRKQAEKVKELEEKLAGMQLQEANNKGFESVLDYQNSLEIANNTANEFKKYLSEVDYPDEVLRLIEEYRHNPSDELLKTIEAEFTVDTIKKVAGANAIFNGQLQQKYNEALNQQIESSAREYLDTNVTKYAEEFKNPAFAALYGEAFRAYGCDLNTDKFVDLMRSFAQSVIKSNGFRTEINKENTRDTDEIAGLNFGGSSNAAKSSNGKSLCAMSDAELDERLSQLI